MKEITRERADEIDAAWNAASPTERLSMKRLQWFSGNSTAYWELEPSELETYAAKRIAELEGGIREYLAELDNPVMDAGVRKVLRDRLRVLTSQRESGSRD